MTEEQRAYQEWLLEAVMEALADGASTLREVVDRCGGADPLTVSQLLGKSDSAGWPRTLGGPSVLDVCVEPTLPPPHPLDFEWRFSVAGAARLIGEARRHGGRDLCLMGATTVAVSARRAGWEGRVLAVDQSTIVVDAARSLGLGIEFVIGDVSQAGCDGSSFDIVMLDPPWYPEYAEAFFAAASRVCSVGGVVLAVMPGDGTRPGMPRERSELIARCRTLGLDLVSHVPQCVGYETPLFEWNAFRAAGVNGNLGSWRKGDLWVFKRVDALAAGPMAECKPLTGWREVAMSPMRIRFRDGSARPGDTRLVSVVRGDVLDTVSRRDPRRAEVQVWTSGNRVFRCSDPETLAVALAARIKCRDEIAASADALGRDLTDKESEWVRTSCDLLSELNYRERDEQSECVKNAERGEGVAA